MNWYYVKAGNRIGPMPLEGLVEAAQSGKLQTSDLVWSDGMPEWVSADAVPDLFSTALPHPLLQRIGGATEYWRKFPYADGRLLVVESGALLPRRCIKTNSPVTDKDMTRREFYQFNAWWGLTIMLGVLMYVVLYYALRKKCVLTYGIAPEVRRRYTNRLLIKWLIAMSLFLGFLFSTASNSPTAIITMLCLFLVSLIILPFGNIPLTVKRWGDERFWIKGCGHEFLMSLSSDYPAAT